MMRLFFVLGFLFMVTSSFSQAGREDRPSLADTAYSDPLFNLESAYEYLDQATVRKSLWRKQGVPVQQALIRLLDHTSLPYDSVKATLNGLDFSSFDLIRERSIIKDSVSIRWLNDSTFIIDSTGWNLDLLLKEETRYHYPVDFSTLAFSDSILDENGMLDSVLFTPDTLQVTVIDTVALGLLHIPMYQYVNQLIVPPPFFPGIHGDSYLSADSTAVVIVDTLYRWKADKNSPLLYVSGQKQLDSMQVAMNTLMIHNERRDSTRLLINDMYGKRTPFWVTTGNNASQRYWVKNYKNDSITLWIGNPASNEISLLLEDDIDVNRLMTEPVHPLSRAPQTPARNLVSMSLLEPDPIFWDYAFSSAFSFNQTYLSNWSKGGESSIATMLDVMGSAIYNNKEANTQWINNARLKFGTLITEEKGLRKNNDEFEIDSKFNRNASGKIGLSASFYMKNQIAKGYNYPNDSVVVSKFLNPSTLTIGLGAEYKPFKHTTLNLAPLSYKNTFVLDTALIDQTKHGIDQDKRSKQELGTQIVLINTLSPLEDLNVTNRLRLFSNYLNHPQNVDVDWELILDKKINWFFTIRLNLHLIYDDDIRVAVFDADDQPVLFPDGTPKKVARAQFKEFVGLSLLFKF